MSRLEPKPTHDNSEEDEDSKISLHPTSRRTKDPIVLTIEELSEEAVERQVTRDESLLTPVSTRIDPAGSLQSHGKGIDHKNILPSSPVKMMSSVRVPE